MKKYIVLIICFVLIGCGGASRMMQNEMSKLRPGMSINEFLSEVPSAIMVEMMENYVCYKVRKSAAQFGVQGGFVYSTRFIYFRDDKLYKIDEGERKTDLKIEIEKEITKTINNN